MSAALDRYYTREEVLAFPDDGNRYELVHGELLVSPSPGVPDRLLQPDVFVAAPIDARATQWDAMRHLSLCVEVLSPSTARYDRFTKRRLYQEQGVPLYWIIDTPARRAEIWTPTATAPLLEETRLAWHPAESAEPFTIELEWLLAP